MSSVALNPAKAEKIFPQPNEKALDFHKTLHAYAATPLVSLPSLAKALGLGQVLVKDESNRLGLPAFKGLGASWAIHSVISENALSGRQTFVTATDGNHGRAVAKFSRELGHDACIVVPRGVHPAALKSIKDEGAKLIELDANYDEAVSYAEKLSHELNYILIQDTSWDGYENIPNLIVEGYATIFREVENECVAQNLPLPDAVIVPTGVGSLLQSALQFYRSSINRSNTRIISVEPQNASCVLESVKLGHPTSVETDTTIMAGLNCGTISSLAWPYILDGLDAAVAISDEQAIQAGQELSILGIDAGPCGAAPLAALRVLLNENLERNIEVGLGLKATSSVLLLVTEGSKANPFPAN